MNRKSSARSKGRKKVQGVPSGKSIGKLKQPENMPRIFLDGEVVTIEEVHRKLKELNRNKTKK